jgi:chromosome segregation ATPase
MESWERMLEDIREAIDLKDATIAERNATIKEQAEKMECEVARRDHLIKELFDKVDEREESLKKANTAIKKALEVIGRQMNKLFHAGRAGDIDDGMKEFVLKYDTTAKEDRK